VAETPVISVAYDDVGTQQGNVTSGGLTDDTQPKLSGTGEAGSTVVITMYGPQSKLTHDIATLTVRADGTWSYQFKGGQKLQTGENVFHITTTDVAGNTATGQDFSLNLVGSNQDDTSTPNAPTVVNFFDDVGATTGYFNSGTTTDDSTPTLHGTAAAGNVVTIYEGSKVLGSVTADGSGHWEYTTPVRADGSHTFTATATSAAGNTSAASAGFVVDVDTYVGPPVLSENAWFESYSSGSWSSVQAPGVTVSVSW
jgi:VCBS repeat-containing protein